MELQSDGKDRESLALTRTPNSEEPRMVILPCVAPPGATWSLSVFGMFVALGTHIELVQAWSRWPCDKKTRSMEGLPLHTFNTDMALFVNV